MTKEKGRAPDILRLVEIQLNKVEILPQTIDLVFLLILSCFYYFLFGLCFILGLLKLIF